MLRLWTRLALVKESDKLPTEFNDILLSQKESDICDTFSSKGYLQTWSGGGEIASWILAIPYIKAGAGKRFKSITKPIRSAQCA